MRSGRIWTSLTSNFSHMTLLHLFPNMYLLYQFAPPVIDVLSSERFCLFYTTAGVASSLASLGYRRMNRSKVLSLGASGAVVATLWLHAYLFPSRRVSLIGTDKTLTFQELAIAYAVFDVAGLLGAFSRIDFAAHLGGALFANVWFCSVREKLVQDLVSNPQNPPFNVQERFRTFLGLSHYHDSDLHNDGNDDDHT